jgi:Fe-S cluster assembly protein SufD
VTHPSRLEDLALPPRRTEAWRWTDLSAIQPALSREPANDAAPDASRWLIGGVDGPVLVFIDGRYDSTTSSPGPVAVSVADMREVREDRRLAALAAEGARHVVTLRVGAEHAAPGTIQIVHVATGGPAHLLLHVELAQDAQASIVETYAGAPESWTNVAATVALAQGARLMRSIRRVSAGGVHTDTTRANVGQGGSYQSTLLLSAADAARIETDAHLTGTGAFASVDGVLLGRGRQVYDVVNGVRHEAENGASRQTWRSVADDGSTLSFSGRIEVARGAQKTDAEQSVKALLLKRTATANAKPELEIFADDVKCAHGATVGELSRDALFYLASRGVPPIDARALLTESFLADALATIGEEEVREAFTADAVAWLKEQA